LGHIYLHKGHTVLTLALAVVLGSTHAPRLGEETGALFHRGELNVYSGNFAVIQNQAQCTQ